MRCRIECSIQSTDLSEVALNPILEEVFPGLDARLVRGATFSFGAGTSEYRSGGSLPIPVDFVRGAQGVRAKPSERSRARSAFNSIAQMIR